MTWQRPSGEICPKCGNMMLEKGNGLCVPTAPVDIWLKNKKTVNACQSNDFVIILSHGGQVYGY